jgi:hypothetical protein
VPPRPSQQRIVEAARRANGKRRWMMGHAALSLPTMLLLAAFGLTISPSERAIASCAAASVSVEQTRVVAGGDLVVDGRDWSAASNDTCGQSAAPGCGNSGGCVIPPNPPIHGISIVLERVRSTEVVPLVDGIDANEDLAFHALVTIPRDTAPGSYRLIAEGAGIEGTTADGWQAIVIRVVAAPNT